MGRRATAIHEAGHAVAAHFHRRAGSTAQVVLDQTGDEILQNSNCAGFHQPARTIPPVVGPLIDHEAVRDRLVVYMAGPEANRRHTRDKETGESGDVALAKSLLVSSLATEIEGLIEEEGDAYMRRVMERLDAMFHARIEAHRKVAAEFIAQRWPHVEAVADALMRRGRLTGDEVVEIIESVEGE